ncbi:MAG: TolC family protein [Prevotellaceae bacterium]|jgi:outer membrane protein TolC|nr:TolC family protein [Prevotellaceae bacterium]
MRKIVLITGLIVFTCEIVWAQQIYTLEMCRDTALKYNRAAAIAGHTENKAKYGEQAYFANFLPNFSASGNYIYTNTKFNQRIESAYLPTFVPDLATGQLMPNVMLLPDGQPIIGPDGNPVFNQYAYFPGMDLGLRLSGTYFAGVGVEQPFFMGGKIMSAYKMAQIGRNMAALNSNLTRVEIVVKIDEAYWMHLKALESKKVALAFKEMVAQLLHNIQDAEISGMKMHNDRLKVQVQMNRAELQLQKADNAIRLSRMNLCQIMGLPTSTEIVLPADFPVEKNIVGVSDEQDATSRIEYSLLEKQVELKSHEIRLVRSDFLPKIGVSANYGYMHGLSLNGTPLIDKASFSALLSVKIPIFHWGEGKNKIRVAKAEKQIAELQRDELSEKMNMEIQQTLNKLNESQTEMEMNMLALEQANENLRIVRDRYEVGMESLAEYLEAQTLWQQASLDLIESKIARRLNGTYYLKATGQLK